MDEPPATDDHDEDDNGDKGASVDDYDDNEDDVLANMDIEHGDKGPSSPSSKLI